MHEGIVLEPVDRVEITTLHQNIVDQTMRCGGPVQPLEAKAGSRTVSSLLAEERRVGVRRRPWTLVVDTRIRLDAE